MTVFSPLAENTEARLIRVIDSDRLVEAWKNAFQIDVASEFRGCKQLYLYECPSTKLRFFLPADAAGSDKLYEQLQKFDWFYQEEKWEYAEALKDLARGSRVLEVGCGTGAFLKKGLAAKMTMSGLEINRQAAASAARSGLPVDCTPLGDFAEKHPASQDAVCAFQVLEHISEPRIFLQQMTAVLRTGGLLVLSVPNLDAYLKNLPDDLMNMPPHHMTHWTAESAKSLERILPLRLKRITPEPLAACHVSEYLHAASSEARRRWKRAGRFLFNRLTRPFFSAVLKSGLRRWVRGRSMYICYEKIPSGASA